MAAQKKTDDTKVVKKTSSNSKSTNTPKKNPSKKTTSKTIEKKETSTSKNKNLKKAETTIKKEANNKVKAKKGSDVKKKTSSTKVKVTPKKSNDSVVIKDKSTESLKKATSKEDKKKESVKIKSKVEKKKATITKENETKSKNKTLEEKQVKKNIKNYIELFCIKVKDKIKKIFNKLKDSFDCLVPVIKLNSKKIRIKIKRIFKSLIVKFKKLNVIISEKIIERKIKNSEKKLIRANRKAIKKANKEIKKQVSEKFDINNLNDVQENKKRKKSLKRKVELVIFIILCIVVMIMLMIPYGTSFYISDASGVILEVPKFVISKEECCNYSASFTTIRSSWALKKDLEAMIDKYEPLNCDDKIYYYNREKDYTITDYGVIERKIFNEVFITYGKGNSCDIKTAFKKLELLDNDFSLKDAKKDGNYVIDGENVYNAESYDNFMKNVKDKIPSILRIVTTNKEGDVLITDLEYLKNGKFIVTYDGTRDRHAKDHRSIVAYKYEHLGVTKKNMVYAYNGKEIITKNPKKEQAYYLFTLKKRF